MEDFFNGNAPGWLFNGPSVDISVVSYNTILKKGIAFGFSLGEQPFN